MVVCPAIVTLVPVVVGHEVQRGRVHEVRDVLPESVFWVLSLVVLVFFFRAWRRLRTRGPAEEELFSRLVLAAPWLGLLGAAAGVWMGSRINASHEETILSLASLVCEDGLGYEASAQQLRDCLPVGLTCSEVEREQRRQNPKAIWLSPADRPGAVCVRQALGVQRKP
jgi:hypothetical protein